MVNYISQLMSRKWYSKLSFIFISSVPPIVQMNEANQYNIAAFAED